MQRYFARIETMDDPAQIIHESCQIISDFNVVRQSYHVTPAFESPTSVSSTFYTQGFSDDWMELYDDADFRANDPIPSRVLASGRMMTWQEAIASDTNTPAQRDYFAAMHAHGLVHGFGVPLFGMEACDAYAAFDFDRPLDDVPDRDVGMVRALAQAAHQRVCILLRSEKSEYDLSEREREVLEWLASGKSIWVIASILDLSPDTVKTYARRIYAKLGVSDRVGAVVKALKFGLIKV